MQQPKVAVIGGGAAGFFAAISCKTHHTRARVVIYEKSGKLLSKVKISGGGRCNVTHACFSDARLVKNYPRGGSRLKKVFSRFSVTETIQWFESRGVKLKTEEDNRMFPVSDDSQTIIDCLLREARSLGIEICMNSDITAIEVFEGEAASGRIRNSRFAITVNHQEKVICDHLIVASGGSPKLSGFQWLADLGHEIFPPVPSLFTFNMPDEPVTRLMGVSVADAVVKIQGAGLVSEGPLLITHWGMSGPAVLKLSSLGARILNEMNYGFNVLVNWLAGISEDELRENLSGGMDMLAKRKISNDNPFGIPGRLWLFLLEKMYVNPEKKWNELSRKEFNKIIRVLTHDEYRVEGKTTFKEEFVTCGGVSLDAISLETMESKKCPGMYFAGEILDIDGLTGGFNFQAAWSTGFIAGKLESHNDLP